jgi:hypothetical protein
MNSFGDASNRVNPLPGGPQHPITMRSLGSENHDLLRRDITLCLRPHVDGRSTCTPEPVGREALVVRA